MGTSIQYIAEYSNTIALYAIVAIMASLCAFQSYKRIDGVMIFNKPLFHLSFWIVCIFLMIATNGADYTMYEYHFVNSNNWNNLIDGPMEPLYFLFNHVIRIFTSDFKVFHALCYFIMTRLIFSTIEKYRQYIHPGFAVLTYTCVYMVQSLNITRMYLAGAIIFWGIRYIIEKQYFKYLIVITVAILLHKSSLCIFLPYGLFMFYNVYRKNEKYLSKILICIAVFAFIYLNRTIFFSGNYDFFGYYAYTYTTGEVHAGFGFLLYYIPILFVIIYTRYGRKQFVNDYFANCMITFFIASAPIYFLSYFVEVLGRAHKLFLYVYMICPYYFVYYKDEERRVNRADQLLLKMVMLLAVMLMSFLMIASIKADGVQYYTTILSEIW